MKQTLTRMVLAAFLAVAVAFSAAAVRADFQNEHLTYKVMYKWGLVNKQAGTATITARNNGGHLNAQLTGRSDPWADKFYRVRDTLRGQINRENFRPVYYEKIAREGSDHKHDRVDYSYPGAKVIGS